MRFSFVKVFEGKCWLCESFISPHSSFFVYFIISLRLKIFTIGIEAFEMIPSNKTQTN